MMKCFEKGKEKGEMNLKLVQFLDLTKKSKKKRIII